MRGVFVVVVLPLFRVVGLITESEGKPAPPWGLGQRPSRFALCRHLQCRLSHIPCP